VKTQCDTVLELLDDGAWHTTLEFVELGILRVSARVFELRRRDFAIEVRVSGRGRRGRSTYAYRLLESGGRVLLRRAEGGTSPPTDDALDPDAELERIARKFPDLFEDRCA
jgi:hypothetical protein